LEPNFPPLRHLPSPYFIPYESNNNRFLFPTPSLVCHWFFCSLPILCACFCGQRGVFFSFNQYGGVGILEGQLCGPGVGVADAIQAEEFLTIFSSHFDGKVRGLQDV
jgi:hypothetical protein